MLSIFLQWDKEPSDVSQVIPKAQTPNFTPEPRTPNTSTLNPNLQRGEEPSGVSQVVVAIVFLANAQSNASTVSERVQCTLQQPPSATQQTQQGAHPRICVCFLCVVSSMHACTHQQERVDAWKAMKEKYGDTVSF